MAAPLMTLAPMPTLPPMPTLAPMVLGGMPPTAAPAVAAAVASTLAPVVMSTLAPEVGEFVSRATGKLGETASTVVANTTMAIKGSLSKSHHAEKVSAPDQGSKVLTDSPVGGTADEKTHMAVPKDEGFVPDAAKPFIIPVIGLVVGAAMMQVESVAMWGKLVLYFGAQSFMNIFMSWALGTHVTIPQGTVLKSGKVLESDLKGCPAGFALTALQQMVSFVLFAIYFCGAYFTPYRYTPKQLKTPFECVSVVIFGCVFAANIALNNFSLGYISIGVNLIIRSCLPLSTYLSQQGLSVFGLYTWKPFRVLEVTLMSVGVVCACLFTWADFEGKLTLGGRFIGVLGCLGSLLCGSLNLALAGVLGETKLSVLDTVAYMAIPATVFLMPIIFFISKPVPGEWQHVGAPTMTDWEVVSETWYYSKSTIAWLFMSGFFSFMYNIVQFTIVHTLSPSATAFGGNFNKAALTFMTLLLPFLQTKPNPPLPYIAWEWIALVVNIYAFTHYSMLQIKAKQEAAAKAHNKMEDEQEESHDEEEGTEDSE